MFRFYKHDQIARVFALLPLLALTLGGTGRAGEPESPGPEVSRDSLMVTGAWLADDAREGRMTGSPGAEAAAAYLARKFADYGLEPAGDDETYLQSFETTVEVGYGDGNRFDIDGVDDLSELTLEKDFVPFSFSESGSASGPVVFAGYGITAPEYAYDDYEGLDVEGKIVLVLRHEPRPRDSEAFDGEADTKHTALRNKTKNARDHGAAAIVFFADPGSRDYEDDPLAKLREIQTLGGGGLLALHVKKDVGEALLRSAGIDVEDWVEAVNEELVPGSEPLDPRIRVTLAVDLMRTRKTTANVIGRLPGTDPEARALVLGAHYDHLGRGNSSSLAPDRIGEIHNGADDNASGTTGLVELARVLAAGPRPVHTLFFTAFTGEELGLNGSQHLVDHPPVPLERMAAMINMDMIGRPQDDHLTIGGVGTAAVFRPILESIDETSPLAFNYDEDGYSASDHTAFFAKGVPVLFFFSGTHEDYHKPSDDWERIDPEGITEAVKVVLRTVEALDTLQAPIQLAAVENPHQSSSGHGEGESFGRGYGPYLGTIPDFGEQTHGVRLAGVRPGSPADQAGIAGGDVVIRFAGREIGDLYDYTDALRAQKAGDRVEIVVLRDGKEMTVEATLGSR